MTLKVRTLIIPRELRVEPEVVGKPIRMPPGKLLYKIIPLGEDPREDLELLRDYMKGEEEEGTGLLGRGTF